MYSGLGNVKMRLVSDRFSKRRGLILIIGILVFSSVFISLWLGIACFVLFKHFLLGLTLLALLIPFTAYLIGFTQTLFKDAFRRYVFELTDTDAVLTIEDKLKQNCSTQMVLLDDIKYVEYYPYLDSACIIFYAPYSQMEVPLWPMGSRAQDVLDFLRGRGIRVVNVQTDDKIPD